MKSIKKISSFLLLLCLFARITQAEVETTPSGNPIVYSVSTIMGNGGYSAVGSLNGGTLLFIECGNIDEIPSQNKVFLVTPDKSAKYPCLIPDNGVNARYISCETTKPTGPIITNLRVTIELTKRPDAITEYSPSNKISLFHYQESSTPYQKLIVPAASVPEQDVNWYGVYRISNTADEAIRKMNIDDQLCDRFEQGELTVLNDETELSANGWGWLPCKVARKQTAGLYQTKLQTIAGYAADRTSFWNRVTIDNQKSYQFAVIGNIQSVNSNQGGTQGQIIDIKGRGFDRDPANNKVKVGGLDCKVLDSFYDRIQCELKAGTTTTIAPFVAGSGISYTRYDVKLRADSFRAQVPTLDASKILSKGVISEPESLNVGENYCTVGKFWFQPYSTGQHKFYVAADDSIELFLYHDQPNTIPTDFTAFYANYRQAYTYSYSNFRTYTSNPTQTSNYLALDKTKKYYGEFYFCQGTGSDHYTIAVEVQNDDGRATSSHYVPQILKIDIDYTPKQFETLKITVFNVTVPIRLDFHVFNINQEYTFHTETPLKLFSDYSDSAMRDAFNNQGGGWFDAQVNHTDFNQNYGTFDANDNTQVLTGRQWFVTFKRYRTFVPEVTIETETYTLPTSNITQVTPPSPPVSGSYKLSVIEPGAGTPQPLTYKNGATNVDTFQFDQVDQVINAFRTYYEQPEIEGWYTESAVDGRIIYLNLKGGLKGVTFGTDLPTIQADTSGLLPSGTAGTVNVLITTVRSASPNTLYEPIPFETLFQVATSPQIEVKSGKDNLIASCTTDCSYAVNAAITPTINSFSETVDGLDIQFTLPTVAGSATRSTTTVTYGGLSCSLDPNEAKSDFVVASTGPQVTNLKCVLPKNSDSTIQTVPGVRPRVHVQNVGFADYDVSVLANTHIPIINSIDHQVGAKKGGAIIRLAGQYFPIKAGAGVKVLIGTNEITTFEYISNTEIFLRVPPMGTNTPNTALKVYVVTTNEAGATVQNVDNGTVNEYTYADQAGSHKILSLSINSASPVLKTPIKIIGENFGTDKSQLQVFLCDRTTFQIKYEAGFQDPALVLTDTEINAILPGGHVDNNLIVLVYKKGIGFSNEDPNAADFQYIIKVTGIDVTTGSTNGGTVITITGENFSVSATDNQVFIGKKPNQFCRIKTATATQIVCTTPARHPDDTLVNNKVTLTVDVVGRLIEDATCLIPGGCTFTYDSALSPTLDAPASLDLNHANAVMTLTGTGFAQGTATTVMFGDQTIVPTAKTDTSVTFNVPFDKLPAASYVVNVHVEPLGCTNSISFKVLHSIGSVTPNTGSIYGEMIQIVGSGFNFPKVTVSTVPVQECVIHCYDHGHIMCRFPDSKSTVGKQYTITVTSDPHAKPQEHVHMNMRRQLDFTSSRILHVDTSTTTFTTSNSSVPLITSVTSSGDAVALSVTIAGTNLVGIDQVYLEINHEGMVHQCNASLPLTGLTFNFVNLCAGTHNLYVHVPNKGFAGFNPTTIQVIQIALQVDAIANVTSSFGGGKQIALTGKGFSTDPAFAHNYVTVCGFYGKIIGTPTTTSLTFQVPSLGTEVIYSVYKPSANPKRLRNQNGDFSVTAGDTTDGTYLTVFNDESKDTYYKKRSNDNCYLEVDFGMDLIVKLSKIQYQIGGAVPEGDVPLLFNTQFTYYDEVTSTYVPFHVTSASSLTKSIQDILATSFTTEAKARKFRISNTSPDPTKQVSCEWGFIKFWGYTYSKKPQGNVIDPVDCEVKIMTHTEMTTLTSHVLYRDAETPFFTSISKKFGTIKGGDSITFTGERLKKNAEGVSSLKIDGVPCTVTANTATSVTCTTGPRPQNVDNTVIPNIEMWVGTTDPRLALFDDQKIHFYYGLRWSDPSTFGGELPPRHGDSVFVPKGQTLLVDQSTQGTLILVLNEGIMIFTDESDMTFDANFILNREGKFIVGTDSETDPYKHKLTFTLHGSYSGPQLPDFGNKVLGCHHCDLDIHGVKRNPTWTFLAKTAEINDVEIELLVDADWQVGEEIVIASTALAVSGDTDQSERRFIIQRKDVNGVVITDKNVNARKFVLAYPLRHRHYSAVETYQFDSDKTTTEQRKFFMRCEVALLNRNIVIRGDELSIKEENGAHMMIHGHATMGAKGRIEYAEFTLVGQPRIIGRYPIHFHMNGDASESYATGNVVHDSFARVTTIHGISNLRYRNNVGYHAQGHNVFLEDGIEEQNIIENNLMISAKQVWFMLQSDVTVANYWITNPKNIVRNNHAAGGDFYGFWYEIKEHPTGPSATEDICPRGNKLLKFENNVAHSMGRFGLRILELAARQFPCAPARDDSLADPWAKNPAYESIFQNFTGFKNFESGILAERTGFARFSEIYLADNKKSNIQFDKTNLTREDVILENALLVGRSQNGNTAEWPVSFYKDSRGITAPKTDRFLARVINFHNYEAGMTPLQSCADCFIVYRWVQGAKTAQFEKISYHNIAAIDNPNNPNAQMIFWEKHRREIFIDRDGSLLKGTNSTYAVTNYITPYYAHFDIPIANQVCANLTNWDTALYCSGTSIRRIVFGHPEPLPIFQYQTMKVWNLDKTNPTPFFNNLTDFEANGKKRFGESVAMKIKLTKDVEHTYAFAFATNYVYNVHWNRGIDWTHFMIFSSIYWTVQDKPVILRFNHSEPRELYENYLMVGNNIWQRDAAGQIMKNPLDNTKLPLKMFQQVASKDDLIDAATGKPNPNCNLGDYFQEKNLDDPDNVIQNLYVCVSANRATLPVEYQAAVDPVIDMNGIRCRKNCPVPNLKCNRSSETLSWQDTNAWLKTGAFQDTANKTYVFGTRKYADFTQDTKLELGWDRTTVPQGNDAGLQILIGCEQNLIIDNNFPNKATDGSGVTTVTLLAHSIIIDGKLTVEENVQKLVIKANWIWVRGGDFRINRITAEGSLPFLGQVEIILTGRKDGNFLLISEAIEVGNKVLAVTGNIELRGIIRQNTRQRLTATATKGSTQIKVQSTAGWVAGDEIAFGPTQDTIVQWEKATIASVDADGVTATLTTPLKFDHYGDTNPTISSTNTNALHVIDPKYGSELDMRGTVGLLTRNIKIRGSDEDNWGCRVFAQDWLKTTNNVTETYLPQVYFSGIEVINCGQRDTLKSAIDFQQVLRNTNRHNIIESSIHDCNGPCFTSDKSQFLNIINNVFYNGEKYLINALSARQITIQNNLLIGARSRVQPDNHAFDEMGAIRMYSPVSIYNDVILVSNNIAQGSEGYGFVFPHVACGDEARNTTNGLHGFFNNQAGLAIAAIMFNTNSKKQNSCTWTGGNAAYRSEVGIMVNPNADGYVEYSKLIVAECQRGITLRYARDQYINQLSAYDIWIGAVVLPSAFNYPTGTYCNQTNAFRMLIVAQGGETFPFAKRPTAFDAICNPPTFDQVAYLQDIQLVNLRVNYTDIPNCLNNHAFITHVDNSDHTGGHYLTNVQCKNCQKSALVNYLDQQPKWLGWFGGCGNFTCTGLENVLIHDYDGKLFGAPNTQVISNNELIGEYENKCVLRKEWNAYECIDTNFAIMEFQDRSVNFQTRMYQPVWVDTGVWKNKLNAWREWSWDPPEPLNERMMRFVSLVQLGGTHNVTYQGQNPPDIDHKLERRHREGTHPAAKSDWVIWKYQFQVPLSVEVSVNGTVRKPSVEVDGVLPKLDGTDCGAHYFWFKNRTIHFVVNADPNCLVKTKLVDMVWISMRLTMTVSEFFDNNRDTKFVDRICAFLDISTDKLKIVGVYSAEKAPGNLGRRFLQAGQMQIDYILQGEAKSDIEKQKKPYVAATQQKILNDMYAKLQVGIVQQKVNLETTLPVQLSYAVYVDNRDTQALAESPLFSGLSDESNFGKSTNILKSNNEGKEVLNNSEEDSSNKEAETRMYVLISICVFAFVVVAGLLVGYKVWKNKKTKNQVRIQDENYDEKDAKSVSAFSQLNKKAPSAIELKQKEEQHISPNQSVDRGDKVVEQDMEHEKQDQCESPIKIRGMEKEMI